MATYWIKVNLSGTGKGPDGLNSIMKKGVENASRYWALKQGLIAMRQEKVAKKFAKDLDAVKDQLTNLEKFYYSKKKEEKEAAEKVLDTLAECIAQIKSETFLEFLGPLAGGGNKLKQVALDQPLAKLGERMDTFNEKTGGHFLMVLRAAGGKDLGGAHAVAFQIGDGQWEFMDPNSCELEFVKPASMKKFVLEFAAEFYVKAKPPYVTFDLYEYHK
jgi:hypothetical protein